MCLLCFENNFLSVGHVCFRFENSFLAIECVRFASKIIFFLSDVFASLRKWFSFYLMCSLRFENNFLTIGHVRFCFKNSCLAIEHVRFPSKLIFFLSDMFAFALKTVFLPSNVFASFRKQFLFYVMCSFRFKNNLLSIEGVRFASISKKTPLLKLSFAFVSLALPLLVQTVKIPPVHKIVLRGICQNLQPY